MTKFKDNITKVMNVLTFLVMIYIIYLLINMDIDFKTYLNGTAFLYIGLAISINLTALFTNAYAYRNVVYTITSLKMNYKVISNIYLRANLAKYVPGNVMHFVNRNIFALKYNISQEKMALSTVIEIFSYIISAGLMIILFAKNSVIKVLVDLYGITFLDDYWYVLVVLGLFSIFVVIYILSLRFKMAYTEMLKDFLKTFLIYGLYLILLSLGFYIVFTKVVLVNLDGTTSIYIFISFIIAWLLGFVTPGASGGLGIREAVLSILIGEIVNIEFIIVAVVVYRFINVLSDVIAYIVVSTILKPEGETL